MDNLMLLQRQFLKPIKILLIITDLLWAALLIPLGILGELEEIIYMFLPLLIVMLVLHLFVLEARKPSAALKRLSPDILDEINRQCLTGLRYGDGILCDNDCLVFVGMVVTAVRLQDVTKLVLTTTKRGMIDVSGSGGADGGTVIDPRFSLLLQAAVANNNRNHRVINGASRMVKGVGTFREANQDTFWRALCDAWKKYSDTEPIER